MAGLLHQRAAAALLLGLAAGAGAGEEAAGIAAALTGGKPGLALRYRYEHVDAGSFSRDANASTVRLRLNYRTDAWRQVSAFAEFDYLGELFADDFDSGAGTSPGRDRYPLVADPEGADLNQLYLDYGGMPGWLWRLGRQRILLDDHRFVGNVGWRQNEQTYDSVSVSVERISRTRLFYAYVANVNRIFGDRVAAGDHRMNTHLLNARVSLAEGWLVTPYFYYIDNDDAPSGSTSTWGARVSGSWPVGKSTLALEAEGARQVDAASAPVSFSAGYQHAALRWQAANGLHAGAGLSLLDGSAARPGSAFRTPLATLHAFQGWADVFVATPGAGIRDLALSGGGALGDWAWNVVYHHFSAASGQGDYGSEWDLSAGRAFGERYRLLLKAARFASGSPEYEDLRKVWLMFTAEF